jgi:hypothetical protein
MGGVKTLRIQGQHMAHSVVITKILPGNYRSQFHIFFESDGVSGELTDYVLVDPIADLGLKSTARLAIEMMTFSLDGFDARIEFDSGLVADRMIWVLPENGDNHVCFDAWGGLKDQSGLDGTGKIQITTSGFATAGSQGSLLLMVRNG